MKREYSDIGGIQQQAADIIRQAYDKGYKAGYVDGKDEAYKNPVPTQDAYNDGLRDAWECVKKIDDMSLEELRPILSTDDIGWIAKTFSAAEVISRIKEYEEKQARCKGCIHLSTEASEYCDGYGCTNFNKYELKQDNEVKIGDEIFYHGGGKNSRKKGVVIGICKNWIEVRFIDSWNSVGVNVDTVTPTGRHFPQIAEVLDQMKEDEQDGEDT